jgi:diketogulonate reductase-like aldo/keto reductase
MTYTRRQFLKLLTLTGAATVFGLYDPFKLLAQTNNRPRGLRTKPIPATGELISVIGMGTWQTFHADGNPRRLQQCVEVLSEFFRLGGGIIDSSPMYGSAEQVLGYCFEQLTGSQPYFSATKIWTMDEQDGRRQVRDAQRFWGINQFDLYQVHNLLNWSAHLETLRELKEQEVVRYIGVTTSHGRRHDELERLMLTQNLDFVQLTYNPVDRDVEDRLLPIAQERGIAVIANRPYRGGSLIRHLKRSPVPDWAAEYGFNTWPDIVLRWIVSHPAVTCAIPATTQVAHMTENMQAGFTELADIEARRDMFKNLQPFLS